MVLLRKEKSIQREKEDKSSTIDIEQRNNKSNQHQRNTDDPPYFLDIPCAPAPGLLHTYQKNQEIDQSRIGPKINKSGFHRKWISYTGVCPHILNKPSAAAHACHFLNCTPLLSTENSEVMANATIFLSGLMNPGPRATVPHGIIKELLAKEAQSREFFWCFWAC